MKNPSRLLLALLAVVGSTAAMAQSSVTLYGRVNTTVEQQKFGNEKVTGVENNASRIGFKGVEDLGGGLKAGFVLESGFHSDDGVGSYDNTGKAQGINFARQSELNLSGNFGMLRLGNFFAESYYATADYVSMHNHDTGLSADMLYAYVMPTNANKIAYRTPDFGGFTAEAAIAMHEKVQGGKNAVDLAANYNMGGLALGAGYSKHDKTNQFGLRAVYSTGPFVIGGYYQRDKNGFDTSATVIESGKRDTFRIAGAYMMGASEFHLNLGRAGKYKNVADSSAMQYTLAYNYNMSKRTKLYTYYTKVDNKVGASYNPYGFNNAAGVDFSSFAVGVRHNF